MLAANTPPTGSPRLTLPVLPQAISVLQACHDNGDCGHCGLCCILPETEVPSVTGDIASPFVPKRAGELCPQLMFDHTTGQTRCAIHRSIHGSPDPRLAPCRNWIGNARQPGTQTYAERLRDIAMADLLLPETPAALDVLNALVASGRLPTDVVHAARQCLNDADLLLNTLYRHVVELSPAEPPQALWQALELPELIRGQPEDIRNIMRSWTGHWNWADHERQQRGANVQRAWKFLEFDTCPVGVHSP